MLTAMKPSYQMSTFCTLTAHLISAPGIDVKPPIEEKKQT